MLTVATFIAINRRINCQLHQPAKACLNSDIEVFLLNHDLIISSSKE